MENTKGFRMEEIDGKRGNDWKKTRYVMLLIVAVAAISGIFFAAHLLRFQLIADAQSVISILTPLVLYSLFVERAIEVFLTVWRGRESDALALEVKQKKQSLTVKGADISGYNGLQQALSQYKGTTRDIAFTSSFVLGILISLAGVRALALFVDPASLDDLSSYQVAWFTVLDIFITGALIGGGSDGIHKIVTMFTTFMDATKERTVAKNEGK
jgi:hypothetical protein